MHPLLSRLFSERTIPPEVKQYLIDQDAAGTDPIDAMMLYYEQENTRENAELLDRLVEMSEE